MNRKEITNDSLNESVRLLKNKLGEIIEKKGKHSFSSRHEILGILEEEFQELKEATRNRDLKEIKSELLDIGVAAIFSVACIEQEELEW